MTYKVYV